MAALLALRCPAWPDHFNRTAVTSEERQALRNLLLQVETSVPFAATPELAHGLEVDCIKNQAACMLLGLCLGVAE